MIKLKVTISIGLAFIILLIAYSCLKDEALKNDTESSLAKNQIENKNRLYISLLNTFPEDRQGYGLESTFIKGISDQPEAYGLVLSAESLRYKKTPSEDGERRIRKAVGWLLENNDLDGDNIPGWGLPQAWDAFQDGTLNPSNQSYTISNALIFEGLLDALSIKSFWSKEEIRKIQTVISEISLFYCNNAWSNDDNGGYFWYSTNKNDAYFTPNVSSAFLGVLARFVSEHPDAFTNEQRGFITKRVDDAANSIVHEVQFRNNAPYWSYVTVPNKLNHEGPNDLVHHTYIIWGMEKYRHFINNIDVPWTLNQSIVSLDNFWKNGKLYDFPQDIVYKGDLESFNKRPSILWGAGMMSVFYSKWGENEKASECINYIYNYYGKWPYLNLWPEWFSQEQNVYPKYTSHVLWGLSYYNYYKDDIAQ